jgi:ABC-type Zn uptake system ZnuABC Zn-binding protein ZnuA
VAVSYGIRLLDVPETLSRTEGEIHIYGNHHIWTEPANAIIIGNNILTGLQRVDPDNAGYYEERYTAWVDKMMRAYAGDELVEMLGRDLLVDLDREGELWSFLTAQTYQGRQLVEYVGGWLGRARSLRDREMACYHKQWSYFTRAFGVSCAVYVEPKPGVPPTPRHVASVISTVRERGISVLLAANYYDRDQVQMVARRTGARAVIIPLNVQAAPNTETYVDLMDVWIDALTEAFSDAAPVSNP